MVEDITPSEVHRKLSNGADLQVVDIRSEPAFRRGHVPGAINVPFHVFPQRIEEIEWGEEIVCVCPHGESSVQAARLLEAYEGVEGDADVKNLEGGYRAYDYELEAAEDLPGSRAGSSDAE
jgi:rhodanese-related sulfurtransferase